MGTERWKRAQTISPRVDVSEVSTTIFDDKNNPTVVTDPLGRTSRYAYDNAGRKIREFTPEMGQTRWTYDARGNLLQTCVMPKSATDLDRACSAGAGDLVSSSTYVEGPLVWSCANLVVCNKPLTETDARSFGTTYSWDTTTGQMTKVVKPLGAQTDLVYDAYAGTDGGTLRLLGRKTEKVSASQNIVTAYAYDAANRYVLKSATVDPGGAASSTTCLQFDAVGNLIGTTDPRAAACP
jgi:YD repeat-containing protein